MTQTQNKINMEQNTNYELGEITGNIGYLDYEKEFHKFVIGYRTDNPTTLVYSSHEINPETHEPNHRTIGEIEGLEKVLGGGFAKLLRNYDDEDSTILYLNLESYAYGGVPKEIMQSLIETTGNQIIKKYNENSRGKITEIRSDVAEPITYSHWRDYLSKKDKELKGGN